MKHFPNIFALEHFFCNSDPNDVPGHWVGLRELREQAEVLGCE